MDIKNHINNIQVLCYVMFIVSGVLFCLSIYLDGGVPGVAYAFAGIGLTLGMVFPVLRYLNQQVNHINEKLNELKK